MCSGIFLSFEYPLNLLSFTFPSLQEANVAEGVKSLAKARQRWMNRRHGSRSVRGFSHCLTERVGE